MVSIEPELAEAISELRHELRVASEAEVYRMLLRRGLDALQAERAAAPAQPARPQQEG